MKRHILIIVAALIAMPLVSCTINVDGNTFGGESIKGNGNIMTRTYEVGAFDEISVSLPATINFTTADDYSCVVRVDENLFEYLDIKVKNGELYLCRQEKDRNTRLKATEFVIEVTAPSLEDINLAGSGTFNVLSPLKAKEMEINVAGSGDVLFEELVVVKEIDANVAGSGSLVFANLEADKFDGNIAGSGDLNVETGVVREAEVTVAGSGDCDLSCDVIDLEVDIAGSGDITAKVSNSIKYNIMGSGSISYFGNPVVSGDKVGRGSVKQISE